MPVLARLCRYPVKGLSAESLEFADLIPGHCLPHDRRFAIAHGASRFDPAHPAWQDKRQFLTLMTHERLAELRVSFDSDSGVLTVERHGRQVVRGNVTKPVGRDLVNQFLAAFMRDRPAAIGGGIRRCLLGQSRPASLADQPGIARRPGASDAKPGGSATLPRQSLSGGYRSMGRA